MLCKHLPLVTRERVVRPLHFARDSGVLLTAGARHSKKELGDMSPFPPSRK
jgi:hypothetical protein